ncbi:hypothetical protein EYF80_057375 [Liparis tanakae]|uniref:Uncharacterized protein n=1 Tax=Liparis tanakae TaxID=230148 RepID=A0A4Z2EUD9_9TELE|nr:hypothetical protein EYF80_057375 [Liparis tanakae]
MDLIHITVLLAACIGLLQGRASEYQLETETLSRCELLRGVAIAEQQGDVPHCAHDGAFRYTLEIRKQFIEHVDIDLI